jgi:hypothetical protein
MIFLLHFATYISRLSVFRRGETFPTNSWASALRKIATSSSSARVKVTDCRFLFHYSEPRPLFSLRADWPISAHSAIDIDKKNMSKIEALVMEGGSLSSKNVFAKGEKSFH